MDARDRLRLYLEQRRELGESELVLDGLAVDDVMALLGARPSSRSPRNERAPVTAMQPPAPRSESRGESRSAPEPTVNAPAPEAPAAPPPPAVRFDASASGADWRETLRQANTSTGAAAGASAGATAGPTPDKQLPAPLAAAASLDDVSNLIAACTACALHKSARHPVPGEGNPHADFVCVGEAPGQHEDEQGRPFVGEAGQLLTKILGAIQLSRESVFICNVLKHRPPGNRDPLPEEVTACEPFLRRQLELLQPRVILALGRFAAQTLLGTTAPLGKLRGQVHSYRGIPVIVTYHPAALLRNEQWKRPTWDDVKLARQILDAARARDGAADGTAGPSVSDR